MVRRGRVHLSIVPAKGGSQTDRALEPPSAVPAEMLLDGRRYRLVPIEMAPVQLAATLTAREAQIVRLVAAGLVNKQIGLELRISEWTVATHLRRIFAKLDVDTRAAMVSKCLADRSSE
jgi:DNA-binding CsgD family transcriptional regulator